MTTETYTPDQRYAPVDQPLRREAQHAAIRALLQTYGEVPSIADLVGNDRKRAARLTKNALVILGWTGEEARTAVTDVLS